MNLIFPSFFFLHHCRNYWTNNKCGIWIVQKYTHLHMNHWLGLCAWKSHELVYDEFMNACKANNKDATGNDNKQILRRKQWIVIDLNSLFERYYTIVLIIYWQRYYSRVLIINWHLMRAMVVLFWLFVASLLRESVEKKMIVKIVWVSNE